MMIAIIFLVMFVMFLIGVPIVYSLGIASLAAIMYVGDIPATIIAQKMWNSVDNFALLAIPFFILAGSIMERGGVSKRIVAFASTLLGRVTGGLGIVGISASMLFAAISGSTPATVAAVGGMIIPEMKKRKYDLPFAAALHTCAGSIGVIIPPSITMILYAVIAEASVGKLFVGGILPGVIMGIGLMVVCYFISKKNGYPKEERASLKDVWVTFKEALLSLFTPVIIVGGILSGVVTATEAAVLAVIYAFILSFFVYKELTLKEMKNVLIETIYVTATVLGVMATAGVFGWILVTNQVPQFVANSIMSVTDNKIIILLLINIVLLIIGTFLDTGAALIIFVPMLIPLAKAVGVDPVHFGVVTVVNLAIGMATPPLGIGLFVGCRIAKIKITDIIKPIMPFLAVMIGVLLLITYVPEIIMFLPNLLGK